MPDNPYKVPCFTPLEGTPYFVNHYSYQFYRHLRLLHRYPQVSLETASLSCGDIRQKPT